MNRNLFVSALAAALALLCSAGLVGAQQSGTAAEAKAMLDRAVAALKANEAAALSQFNDKSNKEFHDRDPLRVLLHNVRRQIHRAPKSGHDGYGRPYH
jgi:hypothetical protein